MHRPPPGVLLSRPDLLELGWSHRAISRAARAGRLSRVRNGFFWLPPDTDPEGAPLTDLDRARATAVVAARAANRAADGSAICDRSALREHRLPVVGAPGLPELTLRPRGTAHVGGAAIYRATLSEDDVTMIDGHLVTSVARTLVDVARHRPTLTAVAAIDAALHRDLVTADELDAVLLRCWNWPRIRRAHRALALSDSRAESPLESISRVVIGWLGLPRPEPQALLYDASGQFVARLDFYWEEYGAAGEADGRMKYRDGDVLADEKNRQEAIEDLRVVVARWQWPHATVRRTELRRRIERAFDRGRARDRSGLRREWTVRPSEPASLSANVISQRWNRPA